MKVCDDEWKSGWLVQVMLVRFDAAFVPGGEYRHAGSSRFSGCIRWFGTRFGAAAGAEVEQAEAQDLVVLAVPFFAIKALPLPTGNDPIIVMQPITFRIGMNEFPRLNVIKKQRHKWSRNIFIHTALSKPLIQLKWRYLHS